MIVKQLLVIVICIMLSSESTSQKYDSVSLVKNPHYQSDNILLISKNPLYSSSVFSYPNFGTKMKPYDLTLKSNYPLLRQDSYFDYLELKNINLNVSYERRINEIPYSEYLNKISSELDKNMGWYFIGACATLGMIECISNGKFRNYHFPTFSDKAEYEKQKIKNVNGEQ